MAETLTFRTYRPDKPVNRGDVLHLVDVLQQHYAAMGDHTTVSSEIVARDMQRLALRVMELPHGESEPAAIEASVRRPLRIW